MNHLKEFSESMERFKKYFPDGEVLKFDTNKFGSIGKIGVERWCNDWERTSRDTPTTDGKWMGHLITDDPQIAEAGAGILESRGWKVRIVRIDTENIKRY